MTWDGCSESPTFGTACHYYVTMPWDTAQCAWIIENSLGEQRRCANAALPISPRLPPMPICHIHEPKLLTWYRDRLTETVRLITTPGKGPDKDPETVVYFVQRTDGRIKIGTTWWLASRMRDLTAEHGELQVLATIPGGPPLEGALHRRFRRARVEGEWFRPHKVLREFIAELTAESVR